MLRYRNTPSISDRRDESSAQSAVFKVCGDSSQSSVLWRGRVRTGQGIHGVELNPEPRLKHGGKNPFKDV